MVQEFFCFLKKGKRKAWLDSCKIYRWWKDMFYCLGEQLQETELTSDLKNGEEQLIAVFHKEEWVSAMDEIGFDYDWDICYSPINCSKAEYQTGYLTGTFCIPKILDSDGKRHEILYFMNGKFFVAIDNDGCVEKIIQNIQMGKNHQAECMERFLYNFISQIIYYGSAVLEEYEQKMIQMEEQVMLRPPDYFYGQLMPLRKNLLELECYYEQVADVIKELRENENDYFSKEKLWYFRTLTERAERMERKTEKLLEQSKQIRDVYQAQMEVRQNQIMQFLTIVSTIFAPLTLLTGWYGMNFGNMPELEKGYPFVILAAVMIMIACVLFFKRKKLL